MLVRVYICTSVCAYGVAMASLYFTVTGVQYWGTSYMLVSRCQPPRCIDVTAAAVAVGGGGGDGGGGGGGGDIVVIVHFCR